jgi:uncharacterized protein (DUF1800 family)
MRFIAVVVALFLPAWAPAAPIGHDGARHLLNRVGFGATDAEIRAFASLERGEAVDRLLAGARREAALKPPAFVDEPFVPYARLAELNAEERQRDLTRRLDEIAQLRDWWLREMIATPSPLTERMTLFWHGHFATSQQKVRSAQLMYRQNALLRREALGSFATLLHEVARDPAMLVYLDNARSRRQAPNENFAREVMELFTLGEGRYSERDIKEAARAFTGWSLDPAAGTFLNRAAWHDPGPKTVLGKTGRFDGDDVLDILLARDETAEFVTAKLWREFVSPAPDAAQVRRLAAVFREARYEVKPLLRALLLSEAFWSSENRAVLVKSPVELVVGTLRIFDVRPADLRAASLVCAMLGQNPFAPPNVKGWPGGEAWINSSTLLGRKQAVERLLRNEDRGDGALQQTRAGMTEVRGAQVSREERLRRAMERGLAAYRVDWARWSRAAPEPAQLQRLLLAMEPAHEIPEAVTGTERVQRIAGDPVFQLK